MADPGWPLQGEVYIAAGQLAQAARQAFAEAGSEGQTVGLATPPFPDALGSENASQAVLLAQEVEAAGFVEDIEYPTAAEAEAGRD